MSDTVVGKHGGATITLRPDGRFSATVTGRTDPVTDATLVGLKKKLDNLARATARSQAVALPAVVLDLSESWDDDGRALRAKWLRGTFAGINAHTQEISFILKGKKEAIRINPDPFFRADDPALPEIERLAAEAVTTAAAAKRARDLLDKAIEQHGFTPRPSYGRGDKTEAALKVELQLIEHLSPEKKP